MWEGCPCPDYRCCALRWEILDTVLAEIVRFMLIWEILQNAKAIIIKKHSAIL